MCGMKKVFLHQSDALLMLYKKFKKCTRRATHVKCQLSCFYLQEVLSRENFCNKNENVIKTCFTCYIKYLLLVKFFIGFKICWKAQVIYIFIIQIEMMSIYNFRDMKCKVELNRTLLSYFYHYSFILEFRRNLHILKLKTFLKDIKKYFSLKYFIGNICQ